MPADVKSDRVILKHPKGPSAEILFFGATVISWKSGSPSNAELKERLFVSSKSALDGSKAVRGGIPVVFPAFGKPTHLDHAKLNQHGFARSEKWSWEGLVMDNNAGVSVRLSLDPTPTIKEKYDTPFHLSYVVTLAEHQLSVDLHVKNPAPSGDLEFQALLHNYFLASANDVVVTPLQNVTYFDKTVNSEEEKSTPKTETRAKVDVRKFTDYVYENPSGEYQIVSPSGTLGIRTKEFKNLVIWNPSQEAGSKIADMEEGGWERFICVEPGFVRGFAKVGAGQTWIGQEVISVLA